MEDKDCGEEMTPARALIVYLNLSAMSRRPIEQAEIRPLAIRTIEHINRLTAEVAELQAKYDALYKRHCEDWQEYP